MKLSVNIILFYFNLIILSTGHRCSFFKTERLMLFFTVLGITVLGGENSKRLDLGIYVKSVTEGGAAWKDGRLKAGKITTCKIEFCCRIVWSVSILSSFDTVELYTFSPGILNYFALCPFVISNHYFEV